MNALARSPSFALAFAMDGDRVRRAASVLEKERGRLESALRRAVPFLARRGIPVTLGYARAMPLSAVLQDIEAPIHVTRLAVQPGDGRGAMVFDAGVLALLLDGVLGGDGSSTPKLESEGLTPPQFAVVQGVVTTILRALGETLYSRLGIRLDPLPGTGANAEAGGEGVPVACALDLSTREGERIGRVVLLLPKESLLHVTGGAEQGAAPKSDPRIVAALDDVELEVIVELTRLRMSLGDVTELRVGDTIPLDVPVDGEVTVRTADRVLMRGRPTTVGGRIAVRTVDASRDD
ncbi:MAG: FliM/FliN family flagellar motor switch protein [Polyangiales bacterium]